MYFISGCKGTCFVLQGNVIYVTEMLQTSLSTFHSQFSAFSGIRRKYIAPVLSPFADRLIPAGYAGGRPQSRLCACPRAGWKACPTVPVSNPGPELGLQPLCGDTGSGASSPANRGKVSASRRCRSTTRGHVPEMYPQCPLVRMLAVLPSGNKATIPNAIRSILTPACEASYRRSIIADLAGAFILSIILPCFPLFASSISWSMRRFSSGIRLKRATSRRWNTGFSLP